MSNSVLAKLAVIISANNAEFQRAFKQSTNTLNTFTGAAKTLSTVLGASLGGAAIFQGLKNAVGIISDFESRMDEVAAITGAVGDEFKSLEKDAMRLGSSTKFTASQVAELQVAYGRLGFTTREILSATEATLDLAAATGEDLAKSADVAGSTVRGFGLNAAETQRVVDVMAASFNQTALGLDNFTESMKYVAPVANAAGASVEETTAMLGVLADSGIRGSMAGTSLRKIFTDMTKDGRPLKERLAELAAKGITLADSFDEVGRTAQTSLLILSKNTDKIDKLTSSFSDVSGEAAKMARIMQDNLHGDVVKLTSAWEGLLIKLGETEPIRSVTQELTHLLNALSGTPDQGLHLENLVEAVKRGFGDIDKGLDPFIKNLAEVRRELGRPIDTKIVEELAEKYDLTSAQANKLYQSLLEVNKSLSFQEQVVAKVQEINQEKGYEDLNKAVDQYKQTLYEQIVAQQINKDELIKFFPHMKEDIKLAEEKIATYRRAINVLNDYAQTLQKVTQAEGTDDTLDRLKNIIPFGPGKVTPPPEVFGSFEELQKAQNELIPEPNRTEAEMWEETTKAIIEQTGAYEDINGQIDAYKEKQQQLQESLRNTGMIVAEVGEAIGQSFADALAGTENFVQGLIRATGQIIEMFLKQSIAAMIAAAIKDPSTPLPFAKIAVAGVGIGLVKSLFGQLGGSGGGGGTGGAPGYTPSQYYGNGNNNITVHGQITGDTISLNQERYGRRRSRVG